jgi:uncharacterized membrane protein
MAANQARNGTIMVIAALCAGGFAAVLGFVGYILGGVGSSLQGDCFNSSTISSYNRCVNASDWSHQLGVISMAVAVAVGVCAAVGLVAAIVYRTRAVQALAAVGVVEGSPARQTTPPPPPPSTV